MESTEETATVSEKPSKTEKAATSPAAAVAPPSPSQQSPAPAQQLPPPATHVYTEWAASLQAFYGSGAAAAAAVAAGAAATTTPQAFFPPSSPSPHPFVWGTQHLMSPYGTPITYSPMYPHGALYAHPSMAVGMAYPTTEPSDGKNKGSAASKGSSGNAGGSPGKSGDGGKVTSGSAESASGSGDSGSEGSSDTRDDNAESRDLSAPKKRSYGNMISEETSQPIIAAQYSGTSAEPSYTSRGRSATKLPVSAPGRTTLAGPPNNLNIGMDLWNTSHAGAVPVRARPMGAGVAMATGRRKGVTAEQHLIQDEKELKRERRKQSNRESARRSRLRKQQECEELARKVAELKNENSALSGELENLQKLCGDLKAENESLEAGLTRFYGAGVASALGIKGESSAMPSVGGDGSDHVHQSPVDSNRNTGKFCTSSGNPESTSR